ncbi:MAG TPA: hypothetical protein VLI04_13655 [Nocardioidaceae bacterium]|nr:hypothetical protein [Nocardioidaceae bacterium]
MTHTITLPEGLPHKMRRLRRDDVGRPVPFFVEYVDGKPDFRIMSAVNLRRAVVENLCWICGTRLERSPRAATFVAGPMCLVNRTSAEPPNHRACAEWSVRACPFLSTPKKVRREAGLPEHADAPGISLTRNPGVTGLIDAEVWRTMPVAGGVLFKFAYIKRVTWHAEGRQATADEVHESIRTGMPHLIKLAKEEGPEAEDALWAMYREVEKWIP